jgi:hypothetical protein
LLAFNPAANRLQRMPRGNLRAAPLVTYRQSPAPTRRAPCRRSGLQHLEAAVVDGSNGSCAWKRASDAVSIRPARERRGRDRARRDSTGSTAGAVGSPRRRADAVSRFSASRHAGHNAFGRFAFQLAARKGNPLPLNELVRQLGAATATGSCFMTPV